MRAKTSAKVIKRLNELGVGQMRYELQKLQNVRDLTNQDEEIDLGNNVSAKRSEIDAWIRAKDKRDRWKGWIGPSLTVLLICIALYNAGLQLTPTGRT
jgi:hypothetical protein